MFRQSGRSTIVSSDRFILVITMAVKTMNVVRAAMPPAATARLTRPVRRNAVWPATPHSANIGP